MSANKRARGTYTLTYYVCDASYLTAGTVTVHVKPPLPTLDVIPIGKQPGRIKIVNTYKHRTFRCDWRGVDQRRPTAGSR